MSNVLATKWCREKEWEGLLDPLDLNLRRTIIHYGERVQAISDAFIKDEKSKNCGLSRYAERHLFSEVGLEKKNPYNYEVTKYLYATTGISTSSNGFIKKSIAIDPTAGDSNWIGYVAVTTDRGTTELGRRDILIAWKGTEELAEDAGTDWTPASEIFGKDSKVHPPPMVHSAWYSMYNTAHERSQFNFLSCRMQVLNEVNRLVQRYKCEEVSITVAGYSSGAAMAILNAVDIVGNEYNKVLNSMFHVTAFGFGVPRVGDPKFQDAVKNLKNRKYLHVLRINNMNDPHVFPNVRRDPILSGLENVGAELMIDTRKSPDLKVFPDDSKEAKSIAHNLEVYLHGVAGAHGLFGLGDFKLEVNREIALVNKWSNALRDELLVLDNWWTTKNKSMVQNDDGSWVLMDRESDDNLI